MSRVNTQWKILLLGVLFLLITGQAGHLSAERSTTTRSGSEGAAAAPSSDSPFSSLRSSGADASADESAAGPARYIVFLTEPAVPSYMGGIGNFAATNPAMNGTRKLDMKSPAVKAYAAHLESAQKALLGEINRTIGRDAELYDMLQYAMNAVIVTLDPAEAAAVAKLPGVSMVEREVFEQIDTDYGPQWIGAPDLWAGGASTGGAPGTKGEGMIVGVMDTGINLDHPSFAKVGGDGYSHTNPLGTGTFLGLCNSDPTNYVCNDKLIGYYIFTGESGEDSDGHGSHTASTAAGNYLVAGTVDLGSYSYSPAISGVAPHANIIAYDVCDSGCGGAAMASAMNQAVQNGVDVMNSSISISGNTWTGSQQQGFFNLFNAGATPVRSAGNDGPGPSTVGPHPPWAVGVAASTHNRAGTNALINMGGGSGTPPADIDGMGFSNNMSGTAPLVYAGDAPYSDALCQTPAATGTFTGKIVVCDRGTNARVAKGYNVLQGGAVGYVLANDAASGDSLVGDIHFLPAVHITYNDGVALKAWMAGGGNPIGQVQGTIINLDPANGDIMASFSSRGPHPVPSLLTPDVSNNGVDILAAYKSGTVSPENPTVEYAIVSGTSMSSPHTAGSAALLMALHPSWTPAEVKSAMMSTGKYVGVLKEDGTTPATPFEIGGGRVNLSEAGNASLLLNETAANFLAADPASSGNPAALNLASMADPACPGTCSWTRTVKATRAGTWNVSVDTPAGSSLTVAPTSFTLAAGASQTLTITANAGSMPNNQYYFAYVIMDLGAGEPGDVIHLTAAIRPTLAVPTIQVSPASLSALQVPDSTSTQNLAIKNVGGAGLNWSIAEAPAELPFELPLNDLDGAFATDAAGPYSLILDDGVPENSIGVGGSFLWFNQFSPGASKFPITLEKVDVMFGSPGSAGGIVVGQTYDLYFYQDADGNPANGATYVGSAKNQQVQAVNGTTWSTTTLGTPITFNGPGDIIIAVVNRTAGVTASTYPASIDETAPQGRSWVGLGGQNTADPPVFPSGTFGTIDSFGFPGNWTVRGFGTANIACDSPADVSWLSLTPTSGSTAPGATSTVAVTFDSSGMSVGDSENAVLCITSNDADAPLTEVEVNLSVDEVANIDVDPLALATSLPSGGADSKSFDISNDGAIPLTWTIKEENQANQPAGIAANWSETFDSYAAGSNLHGQGGWKGWGNDASAGALISVAQAQSTPNSVAVEGATDIIHEFSEGSGRWVFKANQYIPGDYTGQSYFIMLNTYDDAGSNNNWSLQIMFDGATDTVRDNDDTNNTAAMVRDRWVELRAIIDLDNDTIDFFYDGTLMFSGVWSEHASGGGAKAIGAVDLFANNASTVYYDNLSLTALPASCSTVANIPWATLSATGGTTAVNGTSTVDVDFDAAGLTPGTYMGNLCIESNDPDPGPGNGTELVIVSLALTVTTMPPNIDVDKTEFNVTAPDNGSVQETLTISNTGEDALTWTVFEDEVATSNPPSFFNAPTASGPSSLTVAGTTGSARGAFVALAPTDISQMADNTPGQEGVACNANDGSAIRDNSWWRRFYLNEYPAISGWSALEVQSVTVSSGGNAFPGGLPLTINLYTIPHSVTVNTIPLAQLTLIGTANFTSSDALTSYTVPVTGLVDDMVGKDLVVEYHTDGATGSSWYPGANDTGETHPTFISSNACGITAPTPTAGINFPDFHLTMIVSVDEALPAQCTQVTSIPWLSFAPTSGTTAGGASSAVTVTFDGTGLAVGTYTANLCISSNDPNAGPGNGTDLVVVPVTMEVVEGTFYLYLPAVFKP